MIDNPEPENWRELQNSVHRLLTEIGLNAEIEKKVTTPRGKVEIDVWAIDENSVDQICYVVECKNWEATIPQSVVHSFTTVMHETGANIGFIISKNRLQPGAVDYTQNTNIIGLTYLELQYRYLTIWLKKYFTIRIYSIADSLIQYTEPFNSRRERFIEELSTIKKQEFRNLYEKYKNFWMIMTVIQTQNFLNRADVSGSEEMVNFKDKLKSALGEEFSFHSIYYRDLALEICKKIGEVTEKFNCVFGRNIFA